MARGGKGGAAGRANSGRANQSADSPQRRTSNEQGDFQFTSEQDRVLDERIAATADGQTPQQALRGQIDSAYASRAGSRPLNGRSIPVREDQIQQPIFYGNATRLSKVLSLRIAPNRLRALLEVLKSSKRVILRLPSEKLRRLAQEGYRRNLLRDRQLRRKSAAGVQTTDMAPVKDKNPHDVLDDHLKEVIQNLYDMGSITHGYLSESQEPLVKKSIDLTHSLASLSDLTADDSKHPAAAQIRSIIMPPEVIDYVANGRNPDIYTREFVENVQRGNQVLNGKMQAFGSFAEIYARETKSAIPDMAADMDRLMEHSAGFEREGGTGDWKMKKAESKK